MLSPLLRHLLSEEQGRTEWTGTGDRAWAVRRQRRGGGSGGFERYATAVIDMKDYDRRDINVSVEDGKVIVHGCRREGDDSSFEAHETRRSLELPADADASQLRYAKARGVVNLEVPLVKVQRSGGRRHRPEERRLSVEQRRRTVDDDAGTPALGGGSSAADDAAAGAEAMGPWRRRDEAAAAPYVLRVAAPGFSASNVEIILVEGKAIVKALIKDSDGMRSMRHSFVVPASLDAGRMAAEFVAAPTGDGGELLLTAPEVRSAVSGGGGEGLAEGKMGEFAATTQQLSSEFALGGAGIAPDVTAAADRSAQKPLVEAQSLAGTLFPQPPAEGFATPTADAASALPEAAATAEAETPVAPSSYTGGEAKGGAWPLKKSPFELGLEPPPYAAAAEESAGDERRRRLSPPSGDAAALGAATSSVESQVAQQPPLDELMARHSGFERSVPSAPLPTGADEPPAISERAPEAPSSKAAAWPPVSVPAGGGGELEGGEWPPAKSPFELGQEQSRYAAAAEENAGRAGAGDERWWPLPPRGEVAASAATTSKESEVAQQRPPSSPPPSPLHEVIAPRYGSERPVVPAPSTGADEPPAGVEREAPEAQPSAVIGEPASGATAGGDVGASEAWPSMKLSSEEQPLHKVALSRSAGGTEAPEEVERRPEAPEKVERQMEAEEMTSVGGAADVRAHAPVVLPEQLYIIGGEEQHETARSETHEEVESRPEAEEVGVGGAAETGADDAGAVYVPGAYTIRSGQRGYAALAMPTPEKAAAAATERRYGQQSGGDGGSAHRAASPDDVAEEASTFPPSEKARSTTGEEPAPRDAGHAKTFDVAATQQEMRRAHELGGA